MFFIFHFYLKEKENQKSLFRNSIPVAESDEFNSVGRIPTNHTINQAVPVRDELPTVYLTLTASECFSHIGRRVAPDAVKLIRFTDLQKFQTGSHHNTFTGYAENFESELTRIIFSAFACAINKRSNGSL